MHGGGAIFVTDKKSPRKRKDGITCALTRGHSHLMYPPQRTALGGALVGNDRAKLLNPRPIGAVGCVQNKLAASRSGRSVRTSGAVLS